MDHQFGAAPLGRPATLLITALLAYVSMSPHQARATVDNTATATATYNGATISSAPATQSVIVTPAVPSLTVTKTAVPNVNVAAGTVITYTYLITNSGNATVSNISLADSHNGSGAPPVPGSEFLSGDVGTPGDSTDTTPNDGTWSTLAPGDTVAFTATYTVTQNDVDTKQ
jgi:hypothetical protein